MNFSRLNLILFFTRPFSLQSWEKGGMFDREVALYKKLGESLGKVTFVTYGGKEEQSFTDRLNGIHVVCNQWKWREETYVQYLTKVYPLFSHGSALYKSNQVLGSEVALAAARTGHVKFIARCGNIRSLNAARETGADSVMTKKAREIERLVFPSANQVVVATVQMAEYIQEHYHVSESKITVIPNYVQTDVFKPAENSIKNETPQICFIGRLERVKNLAALFEAVVGMDVFINVIGTGSWQEKLKTLASDLGINVQFRGAVSNNLLPAFLQASDIYVQPSLYEGHPKTILEAMACGKPVIAGNSPGIRELILHRENGYLCGTSADEIRSAVREVLSDFDLRTRMGEKARRFAETYFSLDRVVDLELSLYEKVLK